MSQVRTTRDPNLGPQGDELELDAAGEPLETVDPATSRGERSEGTGESSGDLERLAHQPPRTSGEPAAGVAATPAGSASAGSDAGATAGTAAPSSAAAQGVAATAGLELPAGLQRGAPAARMLGQAGHPSTGEPTELAQGSAEPLLQDGLEGAEAGPVDARVGVGAETRGGGEGAGSAADRLAQALRTDIQGAATATAGGFESQLTDGMTPIEGKELAQARASDLRSHAESSAARPAGPMLSPELAASVLRQVRLRLHGGQREATLHLEPAWLGRVSIRLAVRDGRARAELRAERPEALEALEKHLPELRAALVERGFGEGGLELDLGLAGRDGDAPFGAADQRPGLRARIALPAELAGPSAEPNDPRPALQPVPGGIDTYA